MVRLSPFDALKIGITVLAVVRPHHQGGGKVRNLCGIFWAAEGTFCGVHRHWALSNYVCNMKTKKRLYSFRNKNMQTCTSLIPIRNWRFVIQKLSSGHTDVTDKTDWHRFHHHNLKSLFLVLKSTSAIRPFAVISLMMPQHFPAALPFHQTPNVTDGHRKVRQASHCLRLLQISSFLKMESVCRTEVTEDHRKKGDR